MDSAKGAGGENCCGAARFIEDAMFWYNLRCGWAMYRLSGSLPAFCGMLSCCGIFKFRMRFQSTSRSTSESWSDGGGGVALVRIRCSCPVGRESRKCPAGSACADGDALCEWWPWYRCDRWRIADDECGLLFETNEELGRVVYLITKSRHKMTTIQKAYNLSHVVT